MGDIKVTEVYGESQKVTDGLFSEHMIVSEELKDLLGTDPDNMSINPDLNEMLVTVAGDYEQLNGLVHGDLFSIKNSIATDEYLVVEFNAKSDCRDMLQVLKLSTLSDTESVIIDVAGKYSFRAEGKNIESWKMVVLEDKSALLTLTMGTKDVIFR